MIYIYILGGSLVKGSDDLASVASNVWFEICGNKRVDFYAFFLKFTFALKIKNKSLLCGSDERR
jgi:hypothetical protein